MKVQYNQVIALFEQLRQLHEKSMVVCQSIGYNGFKRWHRRRERTFNEWRLSLANELFDKYHEIPEVTIVNHPYTAQSLKENLGFWMALTESSLTALTTLSNQILQGSGAINRVVKKSVCRLQKDKEKVSRWFNRFNSGGWMEHDMHVVDDRLHAHEKKKEDRQCKK